MDNKEFLGLLLLVFGAAALATASYNVFLAGFRFISEEAIIPWCIISLVVFFSGLTILIIKKRA